MNGKQTLYLTTVQEKGGVSAADGMSLVYGTKEMKPLNSGLFRPKAGFYASKPENFEGFPPGGAVEVEGKMYGSAYVLDDARITPTVTLNSDYGEMCLIMSGNSYATDALFSSVFSYEPCTLRDNAVVRGGKHRELTVEDNGYVENTETDNVYVTGSARLINAGDIAISLFGSDTEVNLTGVDTGEKNAASELLKCGYKDWDLGNTQPFTNKTQHSNPYVDTPQNTWSNLDTRDEGYLFRTATSLEEAPLPAEITICLSSTLHKKHKAHCKCMFYYALYLLADPVALHYFARLEGNTKAVESSPLALIPNGTLEDALMRRTVELDVKNESNQTAVQEAFHRNLVIPVKQVKEMQAFKEMARRLSEDNGVIENSVNEALWYLNYLQVAHNITPDEFFKTGEPDEEILEMTARSRGII